jgi:hypothetical protein
LNLTFSGTNGGVRNVKLLRPIAPGSTATHAPTEDFSRVFLSAIAPFHALRFMDYLATNGNIQQHWSDRVTPANATYNVEATGYGWEGKGGPWEYIIKLCNQTRKDAWINIPFDADDDYVRQVARLFRDGL